MSNITSDLSPDFDHSQVTVGTTRAALSASVLRTVTRGIQIVALKSNSGIVYVGKSKVTTLNGLPLNPGDGIFIPISDPTKISLVSDSESQKVALLIT